MTYKLGDAQYIALTVSGRSGELPELVALALSSACLCSLDTVYAIRSPEDGKL